MKKSKVFMSLVASLPIITSLTGVIGIAAGCACKQEEGVSQNYIPSNLLDINGETLYGLKDGSDISKYTTLVIPSSINTISYEAFADKFPSGSCVNTIKFSKNIRRVCNNAFAGCSGITNVDLSEITEEIIPYIDWGNNIFGNTNQPLYINLIFNSSLSDEAKELLKQKLLNAGFPEASFVDKSIGHVTAVESTQECNTAAVGKNEFIIEATEQELQYSFVAIADRDGGTPGVGVKFGEILVTKIYESNSKTKFKASVAAEIINAKNNGDYVTYKVDMIAKDKNGNVQWVQTIENFKLIYKVEAVCVSSIEVSSQIYNPYVGMQIGSEDINVVAKYSDGTIVPVEYGEDGYTIYDSNDKQIMYFDQLGYNLETVGENTFYIYCCKDGLLFKTKFTLEVNESPYAVLPGTLLTNLDPENSSTVTYSGSSFFYSNDGESWNEIVQGTPLIVEPFTAIYIKAKYEENARFTITDGQIHLTGNSTALLLDSQGNIPSEFPSKECFKYKFAGSTGIVSVSNKYLPKMKLTEGCYLGMFKDCTNLVTAPNLPANKLTTNCYKEMFSGCSSLPVVEGGKQDDTNQIFTCKDETCCQDMFKGTKTGGTLYGDSTPRKPYTYYFLDQVTKDDFIDSYSDAFDSYVPSIESLGLDTVTAGDSSLIEGVSVGGESATVTYGADYKATAKFESAEENIVVAGMSKSDFEKMVEQYAENCNMYYYSDDNGLAFMAVDKLDPSKYLYFRTDKNTYVKYIYDSLTSDKLTDLSLSWSGSSGPVVGENKVRIYTYNDEFKERFENYWCDDASANDKTLNGKEVEIVNIQSDEYQATLDTALLNNDSASDDEKVDIFLTEPDYISKYADSEYTSDLIADVGLEEGTFEKAYEYTIDISKDSDGNMKGISWETCPELFIYRRDFAKIFFGSDDPEMIKGYFSDMDKINEVAALLNSEGIQALLSWDGVIKPFKALCTTKLVVDGKLSYDNMNEFLSYILGEPEYWNLSEWVMAGYIDTAEMWSDEWNGKLLIDGLAFGEFAPLWIINNYLDNENDQSVAYNGGWGACPGFSNTFWGGSWVHVAKSSNNIDEAKILIERMMDKDIQISIAENESDVPNNSDAMKYMANESEYQCQALGGENPFVYFGEIAEKISLDTYTIYDWDIMDIIYSNCGPWIRGEASDYVFMMATYNQIFELYPDINPE